LASYLEFLQEKLTIYKKIEPNLYIYEQKPESEEITGLRDKTVALEKRLEQFEREQQEDEMIAKEVKELEKKNPELKNIIEEYLNKELAKQLKQRLFKK